MTDPTRLADPALDAELHRRPDGRSSAEIGRRARLELVFAYRRGRTVVAHAYAEPPYRVGRLFDTGSMAQMILVCCAPGVFAGDRLEQRIRVERGARVQLVSQSAIQIHPAHASAPARIDAFYDVEDDGALDCFWDPVIPFAGARLRQRIDVRLAAHAEFFWSDALMSGRAGSGEAWRFDSLDHELRTSVGGSLKYLERYALDPQSRGLTGIWKAHDANYLGTTLWHSASATAEVAEQAQRRLAAIGGLRAGVDCADRSLLVGRLLAAGGAPFASARALLRNALGRPPLRRP